MRSTSTIILPEQAQKPKLKQQQNNPSKYLSPKTNYYNIQPIDQQVHYLEDNHIEFFNKRSSIQHKQDILNRIHEEEVVLNIKNTKDQDLLLLLLTKQQKSYSDIQTLARSLQNLKFFKKCHKHVSDATMHQLYDSLEYRFFPEGSTVTQIGEAGNEMFIILKGSCYILVPKIKKVNISKVSSEKRDSINAAQEKTLIDQNAELNDMDNDNDAANFAIAKPLDPNSYQKLKLKYKIKNNKNHSFNDTSQAMLIQFGDLSHKKDEQQIATSLQTQKQVNQQLQLHQPSTIINQSTNENNIKMQKTLSYQAYYAKKQKSDTLSKSNLNQNPQKKTQLLESRIASFRTHDTLTPKTLQNIHGLFSSTSSKSIASVFTALQNSQLPLVQKEAHESEDFRSILKLKYRNLEIRRIMGPGEGFGEIALIYGTRRTATVVCSQDTYMLVMNKKLWKSVLSEKDRHRMSGKVNFLRKFSFFQHRSDKMMADIVLQLVKFNLKVNDIVFQENEPANTMYLVQKGSIMLSQLTKRTFTNAQLKDHRIAQPRQNGIRVPLCIIAKNQYFGDDEIVMDQPYRQTKAVALEQTTLFAIQKDQFMKLLDMGDQVSQFYKNFDEKQKSREEILQMSTQTLSPEEIFVDEIQQLENSHLEMESQIIANKQQQQFKQNYNRIIDHFQFQQDQPQFEFDKEFYKGLLKKQMDQHSENLANMKPFIYKNIISCCMIPTKIELTSISNRPSKKQKQIQNNKTIVNSQTEEATQIRMVPQISISEIDLATSMNGGKDEHFPYKQQQYQQVLGITNTQNQNIILSNTTIQQLSIQQKNIQKSALSPLFFSRNDVKCYKQNAVAFLHNKTNFKSLEMKEKLKEKLGIKDYNIQYLKKSADKLQDLLMSINRQDKEITQRRKFQNEKNKSQEKQHKNAKALSNYLKLFSERQNQRTNNNQKQNNLSDECFYNQLSSKNNAKQQQYVSGKQEQ